MARIGYVRRSSTDHDLEGQHDQLASAGCIIIRVERVSEASGEQWELETTLDFLREGDELVVTRLDRLGLDTRDVLNTLRQCEQRGASVTIIDPAISTSGEMGQVVLKVLGMVAEMERRFIKERQQRGIGLGKLKNVFGRGKRHIERYKVRELHSKGLRPSAIAGIVGCSRMTVYRILDEFSVR